MPNTPNYNAAVEQASQRRAQAMQRMTALYQARQAFANKMYQRQEEEMKKAEEARKQHEGNWWKRGLLRAGVGAVGGAMMGAMTMNPLAVAGGAVAGAASGFGSEAVSHYTGGDDMGVGQMGMMATGALANQYGRGTAGAGYEQPTALQQFGTNVGATAPSAAAAYQPLDATQVGVPGYQLPAGFDPYRT